MKNRVHSLAWIKDERPDPEYLPGPWSREIDHQQWVGPITDLVCVIKRNGLGALCGYVLCNRNLGNGEPDFSVHGGITLHTVLPNVGAVASYILVRKPEFFVGYTVYGFDCAHAGDYCPAMGTLSPGRCNLYGSPHDYKDVRYVEIEVANLAVQIRRALDES